MLRDFVLLVLAFVLLWMGSGFSVSGIERLSKVVKISSFLLSFFLLGALTSISEISVAYFSLLDNTPGISVGNLIGASIVLTLFLVPLLVIVNKEIRIDVSAEPINLPVAYIIISLPVLLILDGFVSFFDAFIMFFSYVFLAVTTTKRNTIAERVQQILTHHNTNVFKEVLKIIGGIVLIVYSCKFIVDTMVAYSHNWSIPPFLIGVIFLALGTNLPELTVLIRSLLMKKKAIALGDYIGSASINTIVLGVLTFANGAPIKVNGGVKLNLLVLPVGAILFLYFIRNKRLVRSEGFVLLMLYLIFVMTEFII